MREPRKPHHQTHNESECTCAFLLPLFFETNFKKKCSLLFKKKKKKKKSNTSLAIKDARQLAGYCWLLRNLSLSGACFSLSLFLTTKQQQPTTAAVDELMTTTSSSSSRNEFSNLKLNEERAERVERGEDKI
jgi:hypothetical protein